jgi:hypothetical protein
LIKKGVVCWLHGIRGLLREKPIRMFREGREGASHFAARTVIVRVGRDL